ncbi:hypothetical protein ACFYWP_36895 [Actinacidiphila glaucinigra]|uniref:hypothetical protein n=1 Tax=Actinacidiphila glaucinigra TaxID=235986 RepID=UPI0036BE9B46
MSDYQRTRVRVLRAGDSTSRIVIPAWMRGQITVSVDTADLVAVTGLSRRDLVDVELNATVDLSAPVDTAVNPHAWQLPSVARRAA